MMPLTILVIIFLIQTAYTATFIGAGYICLKAFTVSLAASRFWAAASDTSILCLSQLFFLSILSEEFFPQRVTLMILTIAAKALWCAFTFSFETLTVTFEASTLFAIARNKRLRPLASSVMDS